MATANFNEPLASKSGMDEKPPKKKFKFQAPPQKHQTIHIPRLKELTLAVPGMVHPPTELRAQIVHSPMVAGFDIETHGWEDVESIGGPGQFGFYCICPPAKLKAHIVQIGWAISDNSSTPIVKERLVQPIGFEIQKRATDFHGISQSAAMKEGLPLQAVLSEFMDDMDEVLAKGGRFISHHLEFDAGIIARELVQAGLTSRTRNWMEAVRRGFCTMSPLLGTWLRECQGDQTAAEPNRNILTLPKTVDALRSLGVGQMPHDWKHHSAGSDARTHLEIYRALCELLCRVDGAIANSKSSQ